MTRALAFSRVVSSFKRSCGYSGVRLSNRILLRASSGDSRLTASILTQREIFFALVRSRHLAADGVAGFKIEFAYLRGRHVDVVGTRKVVVVGRAEEAVTVRQNFEDAFGKDVAFFSLCACRILKMMSCLRMPLAHADAQAPHTANHGCLS
jgi:hypothetical protein